MQSTMRSRKSYKRVLIALLISLACTMPASAEIYRCTVGGRSVVQDRPCDAKAKQEVRTVRGGAYSFAGCYRIRYEGLELGSGLDGDIRVFRDGPRWFMSRLDTEGGPNAHHALLREAEPRDFGSITRLSGKTTSSALVGSGPAAGFALFRSSGSLYSTRGPWFGSAERISCPKGAAKFHR